MNNGWDKFPQTAPKVLSKNRHWGEVPNNDFTGTKIKIDPGRRGIKWFDTDYPRQCKYDVEHQKIDKNKLFIDRHFALQISELCFCQD